MAASAGSRRTAALRNTAKNGEVAPQKRRGSPALQSVLANGASKYEGEDDDQNHDQHDHDDERLRQSARGEIVIGLARLLGHGRQVVVAQLAYRFIDFRVVDFRLLQRLLTGF